LIRERSQIIALNQAGISSTQIAVYLNWHNRTVKRWIKRSEENVGELQDKARSGRSPIFKDLAQIKMAISELLKK